MATNSLLPKEGKGPGSAANFESKQSKNKLNDFQDRSKSTACK